MSHHFDSPTAIADGRVNLCDVYASPGPASMSTLILTALADMLGLRGQAPERPAG